MFDDWNPFNGSYRFQKLSRPKLAGGGLHVGLELPNGSVVHLNNVGGAQHVSPEEFGQGRTVTVTATYEVDADQYDLIMGRVSAELRAQRRYHFTDWNCERFVNYLMAEQPVSETFNGAVLVTLLVAAVALIARA